MVIQLKNRALKILLKKSYIDYCEYTNHGYKRSRVHEYLASVLEKVERGEIKRLMVFMPPQHGKSTTISDTFPSWYLGKHPEESVIAVAYGDDLAYRFGKNNRQKIKEFGKEIFNIEVSKEKSSMTDWLISKHNGGMRSVGIGGSITGHGADLLIIDDPFKNREQADSETYREKVWNEWQNTLLTRVHPNGKIIIIMTRWHEDDLAGRLLKTEKENWYIVSLPVVCDSEEDPLNRKLGETLWPEGGYDKKWAEEKKKSVGSRTWEALYMQRPSPSEGGILKRNWWKWYKQLPSDIDEMIQSWDMAFKDKKESDYVVGQVWARKGANKYLVDQVRARMNFPATIRAVKTLSLKWPQARLKLVEDKANGPAVIATLKDEIPGLVPVEPRGSKIARAEAVSPDIEAGNVYLPENAPWIHDFIEECAAFPNGAHDDQVDAMTQALDRLKHNTQTYIEEEMEW
ncbi:phage terminase large subunit [Marinitoga lauensis]|uniref:phage terminase large subunit n=1 Tax=Marinitoga lauensis TaxID=2201189 RepID=UPI001012C066|nr:phage terminase large subunit [Marinitoga lauensis]